MASAQPGATQLNSGRLAAVRVGWAIALVFALASYWEMIPSNYRVTATEWSVEQAYWGVSHWLTYRQWVYTAIGLEYLVGVTFICTALLIFWRCSCDWVAVTVSASFLVLSVFFGIHDNLYTLRLPGPLHALYQAASGFVPLILICSILMLLYIFPNGRFVPRWSGRLVAALIGILSVALATDELASWGGGEIGWIAFVSVMSIAITFGLGAQVYRYKHVATPTERQQTKWVLYGLGLSFGLLVLGLLLSLSVNRDGRRSDAATLLFVVEYIALLALPISFAVALLRYRLWDVDFVISRTLLYAAMTGAVFLIYGAIVGGAGVLLGLQENVLVAMFATGLIAVLIQPIQRWLERAVNHMAYGKRDDQMHVARLVGKQLESASSPEVALAGVTQTVAQALKLPYVALRLNAATTGARTTGSEPTIAAAWGSPSDVLERFPLTFQTVRLGDFVVAARTRDEHLTPADCKVLESIALQAGAAVQAMLLTTQLQASHRALITAREDERRRLRRDLHDGLGPQLASQTLTIDAITRFMDQDAGQAKQLLQDLKRQSQDAVLDIRRIVYALRPPALDDLGLVEALREMAARSAQSIAQVEFVAPNDMPPLSAAVETATYRIAQEALSNALRHADADLIQMSLMVKADALVLEVRDNGVGLAGDSLPGVGLHSMRERAAELGGTVSLRSSPAGATLQAVLPLR